MKSLYKKLKFSLLMLFNLGRSAFQYVAYERTRWRLLPKRFLHSKVH